MKIIMVIVALGTGMGALYAADARDWFQAAPSEPQAPPEPIPLSKRVGAAFEESRLSGDQLEREMESLAKRIQETKTMWGSAPAFPIAGEQGRVEDLRKYLELAIEKGRDFAKGENAYRLLIEQWTAKSKTTGQVFAEAAQDFQAQAEAARFQETKDFFLSVSQWFGAAAAVYEAQATYTIPADVDEQIDRLHEIIDALGLFQSYLVDGGDGYFFADPEGLVAKLDAFQKAVATVTTALDGWAAEIREQLDKTPRSLPVPGT